MIRDIIELYTNWRFLFFLWVTFMPCWAAIIGYFVLKIQEFSNEV